MGHSTLEMGLQEFVAANWTKLDGGANTKRRRRRKGGGNRVVGFGMGGRISSGPLVLLVWQETP